MDRNGRSASRTGAGALHGFVATGAGRRDQALRCLLERLAIAFRGAVLLDDW